MWHVYSKLWIAKAFHVSVSWSNEQSQDLCSALAFIQAIVPHCLNFQ